MMPQQLWYIKLSRELFGLAVGIETCECGITPDQFTQTLSYLSIISEATEIVVTKDVQDPLVAMLKALSDQIALKASYQ